MEGVTIWAITVICFLIAEGVKATGKINEWIPIICGPMETQSRPGSFSASRFR